MHGFLLTRGKGPFEHPLKFFKGRLIRLHRLDQKPDFFITTFLAWVFGFGSRNLLLVAKRALHLGTMLSSSGTLGSLVMRSLGGDAINGYGSSRLKASMKDCTMLTVPSLELPEGSQSTCDDP
jgi:hypothetical protein